VPERRRQRRIADAEQRLVAVAHGEVGNRGALGRQRRSDADHFEHFQRVRMHHPGARSVLRVLQRIDQQMIHPGLLQGSGQREPGGACTNDQNVSLKR